MLRVRCWWCRRSRFKVLTRRRQQLPPEHCVLPGPGQQLFNPGLVTMVTPSRDTEESAEHRRHYTTTRTTTGDSVTHREKAMDADALHITSPWHWQSCLNHYFLNTFLSLLSPTIFGHFVLDDWVKISFSISV